MTTTITQQDFEDLVNIKYTRYREEFLRRCNKARKISRDITNALFEDLNLWEKFPGDSNYNNFVRFVIFHLYKQDGLGKSINDLLLKIEELRSEHLILKETKPEDYKESFSGLNIDTIDQNQIVDFLANHMAITKLTLFAKKYIYNDELRIQRRERIESELALAGLSKEVETPMLRTVIDEAFLVDFLELEDTLIEKKFLINNGGTSLQWKGGQEELVAFVLLLIEFNYLNPYYIYKDKKRTIALKLFFEDRYLVKIGVSWEGIIKNKNSNPPKGKAQACLLTHRHKFTFISYPKIKN